MVTLGEVITRVERFEDRDDFQIYPFAGTYSYAKGIFVGTRKSGSSFALPRIQRIQKDDFVYCKIMAWEGAFGVVPSEADNCVLSNAFVVYETKGSVLEPNFLGYYFKVRSHWKAIGSQSSGTNVRRQSLHPAQFEKSLIPLPPITEQHSIVAHLDAVAEKARQIETKLDEIEADAERLLAILFREAIEDTKWRSMSEVAPQVRREVEIDPEANYTELGIRSFYKGVFHRRVMSGVEYTWQKLYWVACGDLIFSNIMAWEQAIAVAGDRDSNCVGNHRMLTCEVNPEINTPGFLRYYFTTVDGFAKILKASPGTAARNKTLKADVLMTLQVPTPKIEKQIAFDKLQNKIAEMKAKHQETRQELKALLPSMLEQIFTPSATT